MSLSAAIIYHSPVEVHQLLEAGVSPNGIDEYGFTPLIQTAIVNDIRKTSLLLEYGADVQAQDLTGGTALHWAVNNNNMRIAKLLLDRGADVNAYTEWGESVAVKAILRHQSAMRELLNQYGANFNFANDFINAKLLGHRFELRGYADILNHKGYFVEMDLEGFFLEFTLDTIYQSLFDFKKNFISKHLSEYLPVVEQLLQVFRISRQLIKYEHYQIDAEKHQHQINTLLKYPILLLPVSYEGHAISLIKFKQFLGKCDRSLNETFQENVMFYHIQNNRLFDFAFMRHLMYKRQTREFIDEEMLELFNIKPWFELPIGQQITGNCSWANIESSIPVILFFAQMLLKPKANQQEQEIFKKFALFFYQQWREWDKDRALHFVIKEQNQANPARKASIISLLAALLFQRCTANIPHEYERASKIIPILKTPGYEYILKSYIEIYCHHFPTAAGKNLQQLLRLISE